MRKRHFIFGMLMLLIGCTGYDKSGSQVTYTTLDEGRGFTTHVVIGADSATFVDIGNSYATDKAHAYYEGVVINGADPASFSVIKEWGWSRDSRNMYAGTNRIQTCDIDTFRFITNDWQVDSKCVYRLGKILPLANPATFSVVNFWYGKDQQHVYYDSELINGADPHSFELLSGACVVCAHDKSRCYKGAHEVSCENK